MSDRTQAVLDAVRGDTDAANFLLCLMEVAHLWDDLIDKDAPASPSQIDEAFWHALVTIPGNAFYQKHFNQLQPMVASAIIHWQAATFMERTGTDADKQIAFIIRSEYAAIVTQCALIIGGAKWAVDATIAIRRFIHAEGYDNYLLNLQREERARSPK